VKLDGRYSRRLRNTAVYQVVDTQPSSTSTHCLWSTRTRWKPSSWYAHFLRTSNACSVHSLIDDHTERNTQISVSAVLRRSSHSPLGFVLLTLCLCENILIVSINSDYVLNTEVSTLQLSLNRSQVSKGTSPPGIQANHSDGIFLSRLPNDSASRKAIQYLDTLMPS